jgi:hypothetical protein
MTVRRVVRLLQLAGVIATWSGAGSIVLGVFATVCGTALGAVHNNLGLATSIGGRGVVAGLIAGAIVGVCVAVDRIETESYLAKVAVRLPPKTDWTTTVATKARYPEWRMARVKSVRGP